MEGQPQGLTHWGDIIVVVVYFVLVLLVGLWTLCRPNRGSINSYFLAGKNIPWWPIGASLFSSNIGSEHFVGLAGTGAASGIAIVLYEWLAMPLLIMMSWLFLPVYISVGVFTLPEYLQRRFGGERLRIYLSVLAIVLYIVTKLAVSIFAGALFIQLSLGWNMYVSIVVLLFVTAVYTILGGLAAVIYTDTFQTAVMTVGALVLVGISFNKIGGYDKLVPLYMDAIPSVREANNTCGFPRDDAFNILRDPVTSDNPWPGLILQSTLGVFWYFCCDQVIVQRTLAARSLLHAKGGAVMAGYLKILPMFIMIMPGMISRALFPDEVACVDPEECTKYCGNPVGCSNIAYPKLVLKVLPTGLRGLLMAVMLSAIMSSLTSIFNSASTLFTMDLWRKIRRRDNERELLIVGRVFILVLCAISILWIPLVKTSQSGQLFIYIQAVQGYLGTPIGPVFLLAILWKRMTEKAAFWGILIGHVCGVIRMAMDFALQGPKCGEPEDRPPVLYKVHYTYFGQLLFIITTMSIVIISLLTKPRSEEELEGMTWWTRHKPSQTVFEVTVEEEMEDLEKNGTEDLTEDATYDLSDKRSPGRCQKCFIFVCGIPEATSEVKTDTHFKYKAKFLEESPFWKKFLNFNAVLGCAVIAFLVGFYR